MKCKGSRLGCGALLRSEGTVDKERIGRERIMSMRQA
jgi:hypothetical protein